MAKSRQEKRAEKRGKTVRRGPTAIHMLAVDMAQRGITHAEFQVRELQAALDSGAGIEGVQVYIDDKLVEDTPVLVALHAKRLGLSRLDFKDTELIAAMTDGDRIVHDGDQDIVRITLLPHELGDKVERMKGFQQKPIGVQKEVLE